MPLNKKNLTDLESLKPSERRLFIQKLGAVCAGLGLPGSTIVKGLDILGGPALAETSAPEKATYFLEVNLRDQWDFAHCFT